MVDYGCAPAENCVWNLAFLLGMKITSQVVYQTLSASHPFYTYSFNLFTIANVFGMNANVFGMKFCYT